MIGGEPRLPTGLDSPWILRSSPNPRARLRLFCLPHAGGDTWIYRDWQRALPPLVEVCAIRLPGRGSRIGDPPITEFGRLMRLLGQAIRGALDLPFAFYGNSMGALIVFELARQIRRAGGAKPVILGVGSCRAPQLAHFPMLSSLAPDLMLTEMQRRFGVPTGALGQHDELMQLNIPIMRADLQLCESYRYRGSERELDCPIVAYRGAHDTSLEVEVVDAWAVQTSGAFLHHEITGDHFFVIGARTDLLGTLGRDLETAMS